MHTHTCIYIYTPFSFCSFLINQTHREREREREIPLVKPETLERSRSRGDSGSRPGRTFSGNFAIKSFLSEFTEYLRLSFPPLLPLRFASNNGVFGSEFSISLSLCVSLCVYMCLSHRPCICSKTTHYLSMCWTLVQQKAKLYIGILYGL